MEKNLKGLIIITLLVSSVFVIINIEDDTSVGAKTPEVSKKVPKINMKAKPSCRFCKDLKYKWYDKTFINYCPHCKKYNTLRKNPKRVYEKEYTCSKCGADYCGVCGHDKHGNRRIGSKYKLMI